MIQSQIFWMAEEAAWKADLAARRENIARMYGRSGGRRRVAARPGLHLPRRHRHSVAVS
jgi:hypothetical protein